MSESYNFLLSIPIAGIIYYLVDKVSSNFVSDYEYNEKIQKQFIITFIFGIILIFMSYMLFTQNKILHNNSIRYATLFSGIFLSFVSIIFNWNRLSENTKIILMSTAFIILVIYTYYINYQNNIEPEYDYNYDSNGIVIIE
jgi:uncharacterized membrane protein